MSILLAKRDVKKWLREKKQNHYWDGSFLDSTYIIERTEYFKQLQETGRQKCKTLIFSTTRRCNLFCKHCGMRAGEDLVKEMTKDDFIALVPRFQEIGVEKVVFTGGEPLIKPGLFEMNTALKEVGIATGMVTNGLLVRQKLTEIREAKFDSIAVSIDGLGSAHDYIRGREGVFIKTLEALNDISELDVPIVAVSTCVTNTNIDQLEELRKTIFENGANHWILRSIFPTGRAKRYQVLYLNKFQIKDLLDFASKSLEKGYDVSIGEDMGYLGKYDSILRMSPFFSNAGITTMTLLSNGDLKGCDEDFAAIEGNIFKDDLVKIWQEKFDYYRNPPVAEKCTNCKYFEYCRGGYVIGAKIDRRCVKEALDLL